ncbi:MAG TPA: molybdopterin oxidoreductase [Deltaproteobacteria bacterium]|nr:molybdopterin oxidoreductase [Deltaproteobacteria bacterium]
MSETSKPSAEEMRERLLVKASAQGLDYWRSLEEYSRSPSFQAFLENEFPPGAAVWEKIRDHEFSRRTFLRIVGASLAVTGLTSCLRSANKLVPYVRQPEYVIPGNPLFFATTRLHRGYGVGIVVESHEGRPTKIEGNERHPASLGAADAMTQASLLTLYDPDRAQAVTSHGTYSTWDAFFHELGERLRAAASGTAPKFRLLTESIGSPTLGAALQRFLDRFPGTRHHVFEPLSRAFVHQGAQQAFGRDVELRYRFEKAKVIFSLDADFLSQEPGALRYARDFMQGRQVDHGSKTMNRLYAVESTPNLVGAAADHRLALSPRRVGEAARALAQALGVSAGAVEFSREHARWLAAAADDLSRKRGVGLVLAGESQPPEIHFLALAINQSLGNLGPGRPVEMSDPVQAVRADSGASLAELVEDMQAGRVESLLLLGGNPAYTSPADLEFSRALAKVPWKARLGLYNDESSRLCDWQLPESHYLESWGDARGYDGSASLLQPLIAPLYSGRSILQLLSAAMGEAESAEGRDLVSEFWRKQTPGLWLDFELYWQQALESGVLADTAFPPLTLPFQRGAMSASLARAATVSESEGMELQIRLDPNVGDGSFSNNAWLQELPKPLTQLTWDNAAFLSPKSAERLGLQQEDLVKLRYQGRELKAPVWIWPGHADETVTLHTGYGRKNAGAVGNNHGFDAFLLQTSSSPFGGPGLSLRKAWGRGSLVSTQHHSNMEGRHLVQHGTLQQYLWNPHSITVKEPEPSSLYPDVAYKNDAWGMSINLQACIGCNACVVACQAENNIPSVGKEQVARGRKMQWLRIDRYYQGDSADPDTFFSPVPCMHCETAPCEVVCPVEATSHSAEGLNEMTYNRCIGTRYCSNNCPYKVRRFNFLQYSDESTPVLKLGRNPNVTVRSRGVMEKCTYCVQRITRARIEAQKENRAIRDGEVVTACQQSCPTQAIVFGNINDPKSQVAGLKAHPLNYGLLVELGTRPRTTYLARIRNPNPKML